MRCRLRQNVLLGWELGGGYGHAFSLVRIARELATLDLQPILVVKQPHAVLAAGPDSDWPIITAPSIPSPPQPSISFRATSYADILAIRGYAERDVLASHLSAWRRLVDEIAPTVVVANHSPTLCLATRGKAPVINAGVGFNVPPTGKECFPLFPFGGAAFVSQRRLAHVVEEALAAAMPPKSLHSQPPQLPAMFAHAHSMICTYRELDPYRDHRTGDEQLVGPIDGHVKRFPLPPRPRFFAYLAADFPGLDLFFEHVSARSLRGSVYFRGGSPQWNTRIRGMGIEVFDDPAPLAEVLAKSSVVLHHGGGFADSALAAGRPQIVLPRYMAQELMGLAIEEQQIGTSLGGRLSAESVAQTLQDVLHDRALHQRAQELADRVHRRHQRCGARAVAERCQALSQHEANLEEHKRPYPVSSLD